VKPKKTARAKNNKQNVVSIKKQRWAREPVAKENTQESDFDLKSAHTHLLQCSSVLENIETNYNFWSTSVGVPSSFFM